MSNPASVSRPNTPTPPHSVVASRPASPASTASAAAPGQGLHDVLETQLVSSVSGLSIADGLSRPAASTPLEAGAAAPVPKLPNNVMTPALEAALDKASDLLNAGAVSQAIALLAPLPHTLSEAKTHYAYHSRYGQALLGHIDTMNEHNVLGRVSIKAVTQDPQVVISDITAERLGCYVGVCASYGAFLSLLQEPEDRQAFVSKNSQAVLDECELGVKHGLTHAIIEIRLFFIRLAQCNSNNASKGFVERMLQAGRLQESDNIVKSFREVQADPLYAQFVQAGAAANQAISEVGGAHSLVWQGVKESERLRYYAMPEVAAAIALIGGVPTIA